MSKRNAIDEQRDMQESAHMQARGFMFIVVFLVVGLASIGAYALWRGVGSHPEPQPELEVQATQPTVSSEEKDHIDDLIDNLTLEQKVAQLFVVTPEALTGVDQAIAAGDATREALMTYPVGGVIYFSQNLVDPQQTTEMLRSTKNFIKDECGLTPFLCVDEEGGSVVRVADNAAFGVANVGDASLIGASGDAEEARVAARTIGAYLSELGFNVDFAPVADIATAEDQTMTARCFGSTPDDVASMVAAQVDGFLREGVLCSAKHFPGIGGAEGDSHNGRIYSHRTEEQMQSWELVPFKAAIDAGTPMIMVGHLSCLELGRGEGDLPASMSSSVIEGLLRKELGYDGIVITDALNMGAATEVGNDDEQAVNVIKAGADLVLMPNDFQKAYNGLLNAVKSGFVTEDRIDESLRRIIAVKLRLDA